MSNGVAKTGARGDTSPTGIRFPGQLKRHVARRAKSNLRTYSAEIVYLVKRGLEAEARERAGVRAMGVDNSLPVAKP